MSRKWRKNRKCSFYNPNRKFRQSKQSEVQDQASLINSNTRITFQTAQKYDQTKETVLANLSVPELNRNFTIISDTPKSVLLHIKMIKPPTLLQIIEIEPIYKRARRNLEQKPSIFVLTINLQKLELDIYCSEPSIKEAAQTPEDYERLSAFIPNKPRFNLHQTISLRSISKTSTAATKKEFCYATLDKALVTHSTPYTHLFRKMWKLHYLTQLNIQVNVIEKLMRELKEPETRIIRVLIFKRLKELAEAKDATEFKRTIQVLIMGGGNMLNRFEEIKNSIKSHSYQNFLNEQDSFLEEFVKIQKPQIVDFFSRKKEILKKGKKHPLNVFLVGQCISLERSLG